MQWPCIVSYIHRHFGNFRMALEPKCIPDQAVLLRLASVLELERWEMQPNSSWLVRGQKGYSPHSLLKWKSTASSELLILRNCQDLNDPYWQYLFIFLTLRFRYVYLLTYGEYTSWWIHFPSIYRRYTGNNGPRELHASQSAILYEVSYLIYTEA